jgi:hypothetical protein
MAALVRTAAPMAGRQADSAAKTPLSIFGQRASD